jgi:hypothetical protein
VNKQKTQYFKQHSNIQCKFQTKDVSTIQILAQTRIILLQCFYLFYGFFLTINPTTSICIVPCWGQIPNDIGFQ